METNYFLHEVWTEPLSLFIYTYVRVCVCVSVYTHTHINTYIGDINFVLHSVGWTSLPPGSADIDIDVSPQVAQPEFYNPAHFPLPLTENRSKYCLWISLYKFGLLSSSLLADFLEHISWKVYLHYAMKCVS
jgi:hypothetical protein